MEAIESGSGYAVGSMVSPLVMLHAGGWDGNGNGSGGGSLSENPQKWGLRGRGGCANFAVKIENCINLIW